MKKIALILALILLPFSFASAEEKVTITFWHCMADAAGDLINAYVDDFNATVGAEAGIHVEAVFQGAYNEAVTKMNSMIFGGNLKDLPDVMQMDATGKVSYSECEKRYTLDRALADHPDAGLSSFLPAPLNNWALQGVQLGAPFASSTTVTYYNKTVLDSYGIAAPDTLDDIAAMAAVIPAQDGVSIYTCVPNTPLLANWLGQMGSDLVNGNNGTEETATALSCLENGALEAFLGRWQALYQSGALNNANSSSDAFAAGSQLIMTSSSSSVASVLKKVNGAFEVGICDYPRVSADALHGATASGSCLVMFDQGDLRREAAYQFVRYMTGGDVQADFASRTGYAPSCLEAEETQTWQDFVKDNPLFGVALSQLKQTPAGMRSVTVGPSADFYYAIIADISDMLTGGNSPADTAALMAEDLNGMLEQYALSNP